MGIFKFNIFLAIVKLVSSLASHSFSSKYIHHQFLGLFVHDRFFFSDVDGILDNSRYYLNWQNTMSCKRKSQVGHLFFPLFVWCVANDIGVKCVSRIVYAIFTILDNYT